MSECNGELLNFDLDDLTPIELPVTYQGRKYVLREASEAAGMKYQSAVLRGARMEGGKVAGINPDIAEVDSLLVSLCLYAADADGKLSMKDGQPDPRTLVPLTTLRTWPGRTVKAIVKELKRISRIDEDTVDSLEAQKVAVEQRLAEMRAKPTDPNS